MASLPRTRRTKAQKIILIRKALRMADRLGKHVEPGYSRHEDDKYIYHARVHGNWHAGGYVYFATIEEKVSPGGKCKQCKHPYPPKTKKVFDGRWDTFNDTATLSATDGDWNGRIAKMPLPD